MSRFSNICLLGTSLFALCFLPSLSQLHARGAPDIRTRTFTPTESYSHDGFQGHPGEFYGHDGWSRGKYPHYGARDYGYDNPVNYGYYGNQYPGSTGADYSYSNYNTYNDTNFPAPYSQHYNGGDGNGVGAGVYYNVR